MTTTEAIDREAQKAGVIEEFHTYLASPTNRGPLAGPTTNDWTHIRVFKLKPGGTLATLNAGLAAATSRVFPDEERRKQNSARSAELKDLVKQEVWTELQ